MSILAQSKTIPRIIVPRVGKLVDVCRIYNRPTVERCDSIAGQGAGECVGRRDINSKSPVPASLLGVIMAASALLFGAWIVIETVLFGEDVPGYPSLVVGLMVLGGVQLMMIGVLGEYIGKLLWEIKGRPVYFVAEHSVKTANAPGKAGRKSRLPTARSAG